MSKPRDDVGPQRTVTSTTMRGPAPTDAMFEELPVVDPAHYELLGEVASGGIGTIIRAYDKHLQREVALKQLRDGRSGRGRFIREALITARLQHPASCPVLRGRALARRASRSTR